MVWLLLLAFVSGVFVVLVAEIAFIYVWIRKTPRTKPMLVPEQLPVTNPEEIRRFCAQDGATESESCNFINLIFQFLWKEWRDNPKTRNYFIKKLNVEFQEMLLNKAAGKLMEQITVRDYYLGDSLPVIKNATVMKIGAREPSEVPGELDVALDVEYNGGFVIALDVDLIFGKTAYFAVKLCSLKGRLRLQFTRMPCTHWSFSFYEDPVMDIKVESQFDGRNLPQLTSFISNQIRKSVRKKHTLPRYKVRYKPFFLQQSPQDGKKEVYVHNSLMSVGHLEVEVVECSRLPELAKGSRVYCSLSVDSVPWKEDMPIHRSLWPVHEVVIQRAPSGSIGISFTQKFEVGDGERKEIVVTETITPNSPASLVDIQRGDILMAINNIEIESMKQAVKLLKTAGNKLILKVQRPPAPTVGDDTESVMEGSIEDALPEPVKPDRDVVDCSNVLVAEDDSDSEEFVNIVVQEMKHDEAAMNVLRKVSLSAKSSRIASRATTSDALLAPPKAVSHAVFDAEVFPMIDETDSEVLSGLVEVPTPEVFVQSVESTTKDEPSQNLHSQPDASGSPISVKRSKTFSYFSRNKKVKTPLPLSGSQPSSLPSKNVSAVPDSLESARRSAAGKPKQTSPDKQRKFFSNEKKVKMEEKPIISLPSHPLQVSDSDHEDSTGSTPRRAGSQETSSFHSSGTDGEGWDNISQNVDVDSENELEGMSKRTSVLLSNENPVWSELFSFELEKTHKFLNVCVWSKSPDRYRHDVLLGFVSIPIMELALECLSTSSRRSIQRFVLKASAGKSAISRSYLRVMMPGMNPACCFGDILLAYKHTPSIPECRLADEEMRLLAESLNVTSEDAESADGATANVAGGKTEPVIYPEHTFKAMQIYFPTACQNCEKKVWTKVAYQCRVCAMVSHKKCIKKAQANTYCTSKGVRGRPPKWELNGSVGSRILGHVDEVESDSKTPTDDAIKNGDLEPSEAPQPLPNSYRMQMPQLTDLRPGWKDSPQLARAGQRFLRQTNFEDSGSSQGNEENEKSRDSLTSATEAAKLAGREFFASLEEVDRKKKIEDLVRKLQQEISVENESQNLLRQRCSMVDDSDKRDRLLTSLRKSEERGQALTLLMIQYCSALKECMDLEETRADRPISEEAL